MGCFTAARTQSKIKMSSNYFILFVIAFCGVSNAQRPAFGGCPKVKAAKNVQVDKFLGRWYEVERSFYVYEIPTSCTAIDITRPSNSTKELKININTYNRWTRRSSSSQGRAIPTGDGSAVLDYRVNSRLPSTLSRLLPGAGRYAVLATDHSTYAVLYSCSDLRLFHADLIWILGRKPEIPVWARAEAYDVLASAGHNSDHLTLVKHNNCPQYPKVE